MDSRHAVLLTPSISLRLLQALSYTQITRETPRIPFFVFNCLRTLSFSVSCKSCVCHSYANRRGVYQQFPTWNESLAACNPALCRPPLPSSSPTPRFRAGPVGGAAWVRSSAGAADRVRGCKRREIRSKLVLCLPLLREPPG